MRLSFFLDDVYSNKTVNIRKRYSIDNTLRKYVDLCYGDAINSVIKTLPEFNQDGAPLGHMPSNLEKQYRRFLRVITEVGRDEDGMTVERGTKLLAQICESISAPENMFLQEVLSGEISFLPKRLQEQYDRGDRDAV